jgi:hypothetical protein
MGQARIIQLGPSTQITSVTKFDDDFGDFSYASGRRSKRQAKRKEKKAARKERKLTRIADRNEVKTARKSARIGRRTSAQQQRQAKRTGATEMRQGRRTMRKTMASERRAIGEPQDFQDETLDETGVTETPQSDFQTEQGRNDYGNGSDFGYQGQQEEQDYPEDNYSENGYADETMNDGGEGTFEQEASEEDYNPFQDEEEGDVYNFDGVISKEDDPSGELNDENTIQIPEGLGKLAMNFEWNKECVIRLNSKKDDILIKDPNANVDDVETKIELHKDRTNFLKDLMESFTNFEGDFNEDGEFVYYGELPEEFSGADGKPMPRSLKFRKMQRNRALMNARRKRPQTLVKTSLNPIITKNKIVVPAAENSSNMIGPEGNDGSGPRTGLVGLDDRNDYDAPDQLDIKLSNFSGNKINWTGVVIGVGVAAAAIWAIKKYKLIK